MSAKRSSATHLILRIAPQHSCSRNPLNIRNSLIYNVNRYFLILNLGHWYHINNGGRIIQSVLNDFSNTRTKFSN